ncbi:MAG: transcriptional repressor LexA [Candidatus Nanopelagicales bacterium]
MGDIQELGSPQGLSQRQKAILSTIIESVQERGFPPSVRELGQATGLASVSSISYQLSELDRLGYIRRSTNHARGIEVLRDVEGNLLESQSTQTSANDSSVAIPLLGTIAAGVGVIADESVEDILHLPRQLTGFGQLFMLRVKGDSMMNAGIVDGDYVVVRSQPNADNGDIVAALINDEEATVKTFKRVGAQVWLMPHNPEFEPIDGNSAQILGVVTTVLRKLG